MGRLCRKNRTVSERDVYVGTRQVFFLLPALPMSVCTAVFLWTNLASLWPTFTFLCGQIYMLLSPGRQKFHTSNRRPGCSDNKKTLWIKDLANKEREASLGEK